MFKISYYLLFALLFCSATNILHSQEENDTLVNDDQLILTFTEYLAFVKQNHPLIKQADLKLTVAEAELLKARGAFDPVIEADYDRKKFRGLEYYDKLNTAFRIPTWFGLELKGNFEENTGVFLNSESNTPLDGLYSAGISIPILKDLLINDRMATLRRSKLFIQQSEAERTLAINDILYNATRAYLDWVQAEREREIYTDAIINAENRFNAVVRTIALGQEASIDSVEAKIILQDRQLGLEMAKLKLIKAKLYASNFIWLQDIPLEFEENLSPILPQRENFYQPLNLDSIDSQQLTDHPLLTFYDNKIESLSIDVGLKKNNLLPTLDLQYNFLTTEEDQLNTFNTANYKANLYFRFPLFLRKERGDLKLSNAKLKDSQFERANQEIILKNKIEALKKEIGSLAQQNIIVEEMVINYNKLLAAEERMFYMGESSLFLINSREQKLIEGQLKEIDLKLKELEAIARWQNILATADVSL